ncbi:unnamed protein product [Cuscuta epithymum]|uniref:Uncharacterized protein n=1 Tax=Cuscuta epithymum TaxID=186058 RepID=A0AAV0EW06_9ASTE|nr:unnamed protein product [Cuscuta epithymum]
MSTESSCVQVPHMNGGAGDSSYAHNATAPLKVMMKAKPIMEESIKKMFERIIPSQSCFRIADLGCSSGVHALIAASNIMDTIGMAAKEAMKISNTNINEKPPAFQVFLNDLFGNDFNTLFKLIPGFLKEKRKTGGPCFFNATPGSFYGRLFPSQSIHLFFSSFAIHWLAQAPKDIKGEIQLPINERSNVYLTSKAPPSYKDQFKKDLQLFLRSRSDEIVPGGAMLLTLIGRYDTPDFISPSSIFRQVIVDMALENIIEMSKLESLRLPAYYPPAKEILEMIEEEGSFKIESLESLRLCWDGSNLNEDGTDNDLYSLVDVRKRGVFLTRYIRSVFEPLLKAQLGEGLMDELFLRFQNKVVQFMDRLEYPILVLSLFAN